MNKLRPDFIITMIWAIFTFITMILMGVEVIHNQKVVDRLLVTIPAISAIIAGYWFSKRNGHKENGGSP
jgi:hypothetical protein